MLSINAYVVISVFAILGYVLAVRVRNRFTGSTDVTQRYRLSWLIVGIVLLVVPCCGHATTTVAFWTDAWIVLGTDSLIISNGKTTSNCKIDEANDVAIVTDGWVANFSANFYARTIAKEAMAAPGSIQNRHEVFVKRVMGELPKVAEWHRLYNPEEYKRWTRGESPIFDVIFAAIENGHPKIIIDSFGLDSEGQVIHKRLDTTIHPPNKIGLFPAAYGECIRNGCAIEQALEHGPVIAAQRVVNAGIALDPDNSGPPVSIVRVDAQGIHWPKRGLCKALPNAKR